MSKSKVEFASETATDAIPTHQGLYTAILKCGGSTVSLQAKHPDQPDSEFVTLSIPLQDGTRATETDTDDILPLPGGLDYRLDVTAYVAPGFLKITKSSE